METQHQNSAWNVYERVGTSYTLNKNNQYFLLTQFKKAYSDISQECSRLKGSPFMIKSVSIQEGWH